MAKAPKIAKPATAKKPRAAAAPKPPKAAKTPKVAKAPTRKAERAEVSAEDKALFLHHLPKIADLKAKLNTANSNLRNAYKTAKGDGLLKVDFDDAFEMQNAEGEKKRKSAMIRSLTIARWLGLDLGEQLDMFAEPSRVPAADRAFSEGESAAMLGKSANSPYDASTEQHREWMRGWHDTQEKMVLNGIKPTDDKPGLITAAQKEAATQAAAQAEKDRETANAGKAPVTSGVAMTRAQFKAQQAGGGGSARAEAEKMFKKVAAPAT